MKKNKFKAGDRVIYLDGPDMNRSGFSSGTVLEVLNKFPWRNVVEWDDGDATDTFTDEQLELTDD